jgi:hypothetical protein
MTQPTSPFDQALQTMRERATAPDIVHTLDSAYQLGMVSNDLKVLEECIAFLEKNNNTGGAANVRTRYLTIMRGQPGAKFPEILSQISQPQVPQMQRPQQLALTPVVAIPQIPGAPPPGTPVPGGPIPPLYAQGAAVAPALGTVAATVIGPTGNAAVISPPTVAPKPTDEALAKIISETKADTAKSTISLLEFHGRTDLADKVREQFGITKP